MAATLDASVFSYAYGKIPTDFNAFEARCCVINAAIPVGGEYLVDLSEFINRDLLGSIQSVIFTVINPADNHSLVFHHGITGIRFSVNSMVADGAHDGKIIFPYMSPPSTAQHTITGDVDRPFQLIFTNIPLPLICTGFGVY